MFPRGFSRNILCQDSFIWFFFFLSFFFFWNRVLTSWDFFFLPTKDKYQRAAQTQCLHDRKSSSPLSSPCEGACTDSVSLSHWRIFPTDSASHPKLLPWFPEETYGQVLKRISEVKTNQTRISLIIFISTLPESEGWMLAIKLEYFMSVRAWYTE